MYMAVPKQCLHEVLIGVLSKLICPLVILAVMNVIPTEVLAQTPAQQRELKVQQIRSGSALDGRGRLWAVVVGVSQYRFLADEQQLQYAHRDAQEFAAFLRSPNGGGFPSSQLTLLTNEKATLSAMRSALGTMLPRSVEPDDVVVIFFAGHGVVESETEGYLLAHDSDPQNLYATALSVQELDRIVTQRLKARTVILMADACHSGQLGWASRSTEQQILVNRYLDEVGKSGKGVFRLLASRADQKSFEDKRWGGGHGCFTWFLLEGLRGRADRDHDGVVRAAELMDFMAEAVPKATQSLQHPRYAGNIDARLPLAVLSSSKPDAGETVAVRARKVLLEVRGVPGSEVYLDNSFRGRIRPNGVLLVEQLDTGNHDLSVDTPGAVTVAQALSLSAERTIIDLRKPASGNSSSAAPTTAVARSSPLVGQIRQALSKGQVLGAGGAWPLYQQLLRDAPQDQQRNSLETELISSLDAIGQSAIAGYVNASVTELRVDSFHRGAEAFRLLKTLDNSPDQQLDAKYLFCTGRALIIEKRFAEAATVLQKALALDQRAAYSWNALGVAFERLEKEKDALQAFKRAADLAPAWALPHLHIGLHYFNKRDFDKAERDLVQAVRFDPKYPLSRLLLVRTYRQNKKFAEAEVEADRLKQMFPDYAEVWFELGLIYEVSGRHRSAAEAFETGLRLDPNRSDRKALEERIKQNRKLAGR